MTLRLLFGGCLALLAALPAWAGGLSVLPTRIDLSAERAVQSVLLTNTSAQTVTVETEVLVWPHGASGQLASDVVVTPAVVTLPPNQRMRVRVGLLRTGAAEVERAYRLYFTELPALGGLQDAGIGVRLRIGIPVFAAPQRSEPQPLRWSARRAEAGWQVEVRNDGNVHARVAKATLVDGARVEALALPSLYVPARSALAVQLPAGVEPASRIRWLDGDDARESPLALP